MAVYACSDFHGYLKAYNKIKEFINPEDKVYCLGDCGDRGPEPWDTIKAVAKDSQFIYLKGNHEDMLVKAVREVFNDGWAYGCEAQRLLANNGGMDTLDQILGEESPERWIAYLAQLPVYTTYKNIFLCHAGCSLWKDDEKIPSNKDLIWDRLHYFDNSKLLSDTVVVHGHTPMKYLAADLDELIDVKGAYRYADGKKYCIDPGTHMSGKTVLLNLDSFESHCFNLKD